MLNTNLINWHKSLFYLRQLDEHNLAMDGCFDNCKQVDVTEDWPLDVIGAMQNFYAIYGSWALRIIIPASWIFSLSQSPYFISELNFFTASVTLFGFRFKFDSVKIPIAEDPVLEQVKLSNECIAKDILMGVL